MSGGTTTMPRHSASAREVGIAERMPCCPRLVAGRQHHPAAAGAGHHHRPTAQLRPPPDLDHGVERIHVDVQDRAVAVVDRHRVGADVPARVSAVGHRPRQLGSRPTAIRPAGRVQRRCRRPARGFLPAVGDIGAAIRRSPGDNVQVGGDLPQHRMNCRLGLQPRQFAVAAGHGLPRRAGDQTGQHPDTRHGFARQARIGQQLADRLRRRSDGAAGRCRQTGHPGRRAWLWPRRTDRPGSGRAPRRAGRRSAPKHIHRVEPPPPAQRQPQPDRRPLPAGDGTAPDRRGRPRPPVPAIPRPPGRRSPGRQPRRPRPGGAGSPARRPKSRRP